MLSSYFSGNNVSDEYSRKCSELNIFQSPEIFFTWINLLIHVDLNVFYILMLGGSLYYETEVYR